MLYWWNTKIREVKSNEKAVNGTAGGFLYDCFHDRKRHSWFQQQNRKQRMKWLLPCLQLSEPEAGFDPAYGWGAGEHVHEPLIQSTLTVTNKDLSIGMDLATDYSVSEDGLIWTVKIRDDVKFTDGEPLTAKDVAFTYNTAATTALSMIFPCWRKPLQWMIPQ